MTSSRPRLIVVLGMHRSGTSVTTNLLNALGVPLSDDLMEPTEHNAKGYFESKEISRLHDAILARMGMDWKTSSMIVPFPKEWWRATEIRRFRDELAAIAAREIERHGGLWGFKDPRTARLLPLWNDIVDEHGFDTKFVLVTRDPNAVAKSLYAREHIDPFHAEVMWLEHNADAVLNARNRIHAIVDYRHWMDNPVEQATYLIERLELPWKGSTPELTSIIDSVIDPNLRHHSSDSVSTRLPFTAPMYSAFVKRDFVSLKSLSEVFNISRGFSQVMLAGARTDFESNLARMSAVIDVQAREIAMLRARLATEHTEVL